MSDRRVLIFTDADNTLWDTDAVYTDGQLRLLKDVETAIGIHGPTANRLEFVREYDQEIAAKHHKRLRYPPALLAHAVAFGLQGRNSRAAAKVVRLGQYREDGLSTDEAGTIAQRFSEGLRARPQLRPGVREGLVHFAKRGYTTIVVTEGAKSKCRDLLRFYDLEQFVARVIESPKHPDLYRRVCRLGGGADVSVMIGDQLDRDILPAKEAGLVTIFFPGGFRPKWEPDNATVFIDYCIYSFDEVAHIVEQLLAAEYSKAQAYLALPNR